MTASKEAVLIGKILHKHGARPDLRLWRNETAVAWVGRHRGRTQEGDIVLFKGARRILAGLCVGSPDLIGVGLGGKFLALEVKTEGVATTEQQTKFLDLVNELGGIAGIVRSVDDATKLLGEPPK